MWLQRDHQDRCSCDLQSYPPSTQHSLVAHAQQLWNEWEIQCLVLLSMSLQVFLLFAAVFRKRHGSRALSVALWLAYLSADSVAVFVLGRLTLLLGDDPRHQMALFWAPFLLLHLGGQETIAAFSMEDCALWKRHLLNLATQAMLAVYVVGKQWRGDRRLLAPTALVFVSGMAKYAERIWALRRAGSRSSSLQSSSSVEFAVSSAETVFNTRSKAYYKKLGSIISDGQEKNFERVVKLATEGFQLCLDFIMDMAPPRPSYRYHLGEYLISHSPSSSDGSLADKAYKLAEIHLSLTYDFLYTKFGALMGVFYRLATLALTSTALALFASARVDRKGPSVSYSEADVAISYVLLVGAVTLELSSVFVWILSSYSPYMTISSLLGDVPLRVRHQFVPVSSLHGRVPSRGRLQYFEPRIVRRRRRPKALRWAGKVLHSIVKNLHAEGRVEWSRRMQQYNIFDGCIQEKRIGWFGKALRSVGIERDCSPPVAVSAEVKKVVFDKMHAWSHAEELDLTRFRGHWAQRWAFIEVQRHHQHNTAHILEPPSSENAAPDQHTTVSSEIAAATEDQQTTLPSETATEDQQAVPSSEIAAEDHQQPDTIPPSEESAAQRALQISDIQDLDFASSAFLWHLVTDICLVAGSENTTDEDGGFRSSSRDLSNYVMHLVIKCRSILGRNGSNRLVYNRQHLMMHVYDGNDIDRKDYFTQKLQNIVCIDTPHSNIFKQAHLVALELLKIEAAADRWELIATVWVEMLCYVAHNCEAGFHAKQLSAGGEFVSHVKIYYPCQKQHVPCADVL